MVAVAAIVGSPSMEYLQFADPPFDYEEICISMENFSFCGFD